MLAEKYLTDLGITVEQANDFINANIGDPEKIFKTASELGVTTRMLSEISGYSRNSVQKYFADINPDWSKLLDKSKLVNSDLGSLEDIVAFNAREGILSNASLRAIVKPKIDSLDYASYNETFESSFPDLQLKDGLYTSGELGVEHIDDIEATSGNIESLFYGTLINMLSTLDESEFDQIITFPDNGNSEDFQTLLLAALKELPTPIVWSDENLATKVTDEAVNILKKYWTDDLFGILDHSYLGLATV
ncbi:MAG: hypothetical protein DU481_15395 [Nitrosomonas sp.]|uniref:hypothetical protein n=1 Tax=Nitrosomonas sp. TaxID=42353 RepID=UPI0032EE78B5